MIGDVLSVAFYVDSGVCVKVFFVGCAGMSRLSVFLTEGS